ncbi:MAG: TolC family protein [Deltaproteobacteria bacterium]|nr:TolC family protein [Deltaproteobacteria bacterium]
MNGKQIPKIIMFFVTLFILPVHTGAMDITTLLKAVEKQPQAKIDQLAIEQEKTAVKKAYSSLYPKVSAIGSYENYNSPTNLRPLPPTEVNIQAGEAIPFSRNIGRYGITATMPVFVKEIFDTAKQIKSLSRKSEVKKEITIIGNQSAVVSLNSSFTYLSHLDKLIHERIASLSKTREIVEIQVNNGRLPESELFKVEQLIEKLRLQQSTISGNMIAVSHALFAMTGIHLDAPVPMSLSKEFPARGQYITLALLKKDIEAATYELQARKDYRYPKIFLQGSFTENIGSAYNTDDLISRHYRKLSLGLVFPLFDRTAHVDEQLARIRLKKAKEKYRKTKQDLDAKASRIRQQGPVIENALQQSEKTIALSKKILKVAKVAYKNRRMTIEDYLKYEVDVLDAETQKSYWKDQQWRLIADQALLFGQDLQGVIQ